MDTTAKIEIVAGIVLVGILVLFINPFMFWMPSMFSYGALALALVGFGVFGGMVWREQARDEREADHARRASRAAYIAGLGTLVVGALYQALTNMVDTWVFAAIAVMVLVKLAARLYASRHH
jgi:hypothetical protein